MTSMSPFVLFQGKYDNKNRDDSDSNRESQKVLSIKENDKKETQNKENTYHRQVYLILYSRYFRPKQAKKKGQTSNDMEVEDYTMNKSSLSYVKIVYSIT